MGNKEREEHASAKQQLNTQQAENNMVMAELNLVKDECILYKMVGPALIKQDNEEVKLNVGNRLKHIKGEMERHDKAIKDTAVKSKDIEVGLKKLEEQLFKQMEAGGMSQPKK